ncbi:MAG: sigma-54-dependent Fis family transcriptional regulator [Bacteroidaceae bacterium]|nr:sigma-54-dependent Fis family transcriptional regulator [Bacteroidaceae bacterium]
MILVIDDDSAIRTSLGFMLKRAGYEVQTVATPKEAMAIVRNEEPRLILMDMNFSLSTSGEEGLTLLKQVKLFRPEVPVILMTAWGSINLAVQGMQAGAFDFVTKPWNNVALMQRIETALQLTETKDNGLFLEQRRQGDAQSSMVNGQSSMVNGIDRSFIIGQSKALNDVLKVVERIAKTNASVLITGESGTGKELIAEAIHRNSRRADKPFVKVNLGGISQSLFESEMFGHKKGAFTDAVADRKGRFELADKGTIFLDEIGELDLSCQVKLLRVLQEQTFEPLGDSKPKKVDIRVVSATNANLQQMVQEKTFREDLFYRINLITIHLPALRERKEDIPLLAAFFAKKQCEANGLSPVEISQEANEYLASLPFPGNIRELKNLVERTILVSANNPLQASDFEKQHQGVSMPANANAEGMTLDEVERLTILKAYEKYHGNISQMATALGLTRQALYRRMVKFNIGI